MAIDIINMLALIALIVFSVFGTVVCIGGAVYGAVKRLLARRYRA